MRQYLTITILIISINLAKADSPLTSIKFWDLSDDPYVLNIGNLPGKKTLDLTAFQYLINPANSKANKYALVNALGWEYRSKVKNSDNYIEFIYQNFEKEILEVKKKKPLYTDSKFNRQELVRNFMMTNLQCEYMKLFVYLRAMDDYFLTDQSAYLLFDHAIRLPVASDWDVFVESLIKAQYNVLKMDFNKLSNTIHTLNTLRINDDSLKTSVDRSLNYLCHYFG